MTQIPTWSGGPVNPSNGRATAGATVGGRYELRAAVGHGGMGTVWRAADTLLRRDVAVKEVVLPPGLAPSDRDAMYERTLREARAAAALQHPAVVQVYDVVTEGGRPWIVMELLDARSLADMVIEDGPLAPRAVAKIGIALLGALEVAHAAGVLHRDVKPANVLIGADGRCVLTDFGVARMPTDVQLTTPGMVLGSPHFISPERAMGQEFGPPSDLFSLGVTLYTAVEGRPPFDKGDPIETMHAVVEDPPAPPTKSGPLTQVLYGLLEKDPARRFDVATSRAMLRELLAGPLASNAPGHLTTDPYSVVPVPRPHWQPPSAAAPKPTGQIGGRAMIAPGQSITDRLAELRNAGRNLPTPAQYAAAGLENTNPDALATPAGSAADRPNGDGQTASGPSTPRQPGTASGPSTPRQPGSPEAGDPISIATTARISGNDSITTARISTGAPSPTPGGAPAGSVDIPTGPMPTRPSAGTVSPGGAAGMPVAGQPVSPVGGVDSPTSALPPGVRPGTVFGIPASVPSPGHGPAQWQQPAAGPGGPAGGWPGAAGSPQQVGGQPGGDTPGLREALSVTGDALSTKIKRVPRQAQLAVAGGLAAILLIISGIVLFNGDDEEQPQLPQTLVSPTAAAASFETQVYAARGLSVNVPKGWKKSGTSIYTDFTDPDNSGRRVRILVERASAQPLNFLQAAAKRLENNSSSSCARPYNELGLRDGVELAGKPAAEYEYTCGEGDSMRHGLWRAIVSDGKAYSFYLTTPNGRFEESKPIYDEMVRSFQLTGAS